LEFVSVEESDVDIEEQRRTQANRHCRLLNLAYVRLKDEEKSALEKKNFVAFDF
jgi:hypothetical protein